jgi:hypothetical protein
MSMTPEARILKKVTAFVRSQGGVVVRLTFARGVSAGWPDVLALFPHGQCLFVELKRPGSRPSPLQMHRIGVLCELGYKATWADSFDAARGAIEDSLRAVGGRALKSGIPDALESRTAEHGVRSQRSLRKRIRSTATRS